MAKPILGWEYRFIPRGHDSTIPLVWPGLGCLSPLTFGPQRRRGWFIHPGRPLRARSGRRPRCHQRNPGGHHRAGHLHRHRLQPGGKRKIRTQAAALDLVFSDGVKGHTTRVKQVD